MPEKIMVVPASNISSAFGEDSSRVIPISFTDFDSFITERSEFLPRPLMENDPSYKQIISYCLIECGEYVFIAKRTKKQTESRLHNQYSVGIGGHISLIDSTGDSILMQGMQRELSEEVSIESAYECDFYGIINDNSTEVNSVHVGACFIIKLDEQKCVIRETDKHEGLWIKKKDIFEYYDALEGWSKIFVDTYIGEAK